MTVLVGLYHKEVLHSMQIQKGCPSRTGVCTECILLFWSDARLNILQNPGMVENFVPFREKHAAPTIPIGADLDVQYTLLITMLPVHGIIIPMEGYIDQGTAQIRSFFHGMWSWICILFG